MPADVKGDAVSVAPGPDNLRKRVVVGPVEFVQPTRQIRTGDRRMLQGDAACVGHAVDEADTTPSSDFSVG